MKTRKMILLILVAIALTSLSCATIRKAPCKVYETNSSMVKKNKHLKQKPKTHVISTINSHPYKKNRKK